MKKIGILSFVVLFMSGLFFQSCEELNNYLGDDTVAGLKQALTISTDTTVAQGGVENGFYQNLAIKILFPQEAQEILDYVDAYPVLGMALDGLTENFVHRMNQAAEKATPLAKDIFVETITNITFDDA